MPDIIIETYRSADGSYYQERREENRKNTTSFGRRADDEKPKDVVIFTEFVAVDDDTTGPYKVSDRSLGQKIDIMV